MGCAKSSVQRFESNSLCKEKEKIEEQSKISREEVKIQENTYDEISNVYTKDSKKGKPTEVIEEEKSLSHFYSEYDQLDDIVDLKEKSTAQISDGNYDESSFFSNEQLLKIFVDLGSSEGKEKRKRKYLPPHEGNSRNWNGDFQELFDQIASTNDKIKERELRKEKLISNFLEFAGSTAQIIVQELSLKEEEKLLKPVQNVGGLAGGKKYIYGNILFKVCVNEHNIYQNLNLMQKAASNEIRAMKALINAKIPKLHTTLTAYFNILGQGIIATALAPLGKGTLIYGSCDGGKTFEKNEEELEEVEELLRLLGENYSLMPHYARFRANEETLRIPLCADLEVHRGKDGRLYALDLARLFPPTPPRRRKKQLLKEKGSFLAYHFRPEFLSNLTIGVSNDALSGFIQGTPDCEMQNKSIFLAWKHGMDPLLKSVAEEIDKNEGQLVLNEYLHERGVNLRYLGLIHKTCRNLKSKSCIEREMTSRTLKLMFREQCQEIQGQLVHSNTDLKNVKFVELISLKALLMKMKDPNSFYPFFESLLRKKYEELDLQSLNIFQLNMNEILISELGIETEIGGAPNLKQISSFEPLNCIEWTFTKSKKAKIVDPPRFLTLKESKVYLIEALKSKEKNLGKDSLKLVHALWKVIEMYRVWRDQDAKLCELEGQKYIERVLRILPDDYKQWFRAGKFFKEFGSFDIALKHLGKSLELFNSTELEKVPILITIATIKLQKGHPLETVKIYKTCLDLISAENFRDHPLLGILLNKIGMAYINMGNYDEAEKAFEKSRIIKLEKFGSDHPLYANTLNNLGILYKSKGEYEKALEMYNLCESIRYKRLGEEHPLYAQCFHNIGLIYSKKRNYSKAITFYEMCDKIWKKTIGINHPFYAQLLNSLCFAYKKKKNYDKAIELGKNSLAIKEKTVGVSNPSYALAYNAKQDYEKAIELHQECLSIRKKVLGVEHPDYAQSLNNLALVFGNKKDFEKSIELHKECLQRRKEKLGVKHLDYSSSLLNIGLCFYFMGEFEKAIEYFEECYRIRKLIEFKDDYKGGVKIWIKRTKAKLKESVKNVDSEKISVAGSDEEKENE